jgi:hypothetical protein
MEGFNVLMVMGVDKMGPTEPLQLISISKR